MTPATAPIPVTLPNDRDAPAAAVKCIGGPAADDVRLMRIRDAASLADLEVPEAFAAEIQDRDVVRGIDARVPST